jgi:spore maturation protein CgeB
MRMSANVRVSILGKNNSILSWREDLSDAFQSLKVDARIHNLQSESVPEYVEEFFTKRRQLLNTSTSSRIARELKEYRPDLVIIMNKAGLSSHANEKWRKVLPATVPIIGWICDRMKRFPLEQEPNLDGLYYFDSASKQVMEKAYVKTDIKIRCLPLAASPKRFGYAEIPFENLIPELVFVGNCTPVRREEILSYRAIGGKIQVYGPNSEGLTLSSNCRIFNSDEQATLYRKHFACFNPPQPTNTLHGLNLRAFEIPLCGGIGTYPSSAEDLSRCFEPGKEVIAYNSLSDLKDQIDVLTTDSARYIAIREAGRQRVLQEHTFVHRAQTILSDWMSF